MRYKVVPYLTSVNEKSFSNNLSEPHNAVCFPLIPFTLAPNSGSLVILSFPERSGHQSENETKKMLNAESMVRRISGPQTRKLELPCTA